MINEPKNASDFSGAVLTAFACLQPEIRNTNVMNEIQGETKMNLFASLHRTARSMPSTGAALTLSTALILGAGSQAQAAPLNLTLLDTPDIFSSFIDVNYVAATDAFTASGFAMTLDDDGSVPPEDIAGGSFDLSASINDTGLLASGTLAIGGTVAALGFNSGTLLTGNLTAFGFPGGGGDPLEFLFSVTGGDAAGLYGGVGSTGGVLLTGGTGFTGDFTADFRGAGTAVADVAPIPLPAAAWLFGTGLLGLIGLGRKRSRA